MAGVCITAEQSGRGEMEAGVGRDWTGEGRGKGRGRRMRGNLGYLSNR